MTQDEYDKIALYVRDLTARRITHPDKQVLDECQRFLEEFCKNAEENGFEAPPIPTAPVNVDIPHVYDPQFPSNDDTAGVGATLTCTMGNWEGKPTSYAYEWLNDGYPALNGNTANLTVVEGDKGHTLTCVVTATNAQGSTEAPPSNGVAVVEGVGTHTAEVLNRLRDDLLKVLTP